MLRSHIHILVLLEFVDLADLFIEIRVSISDRGFGAADQSAFGAAESLLDDRSGAVVVQVGGYFLHGFVTDYTVHFNSPWLGLGFLLALKVS